MNLIKSLLFLSLILYAVQAAKKVVKKQEETKDALAPKKTIQKQVAAKNDKTENVIELSDSCSRKKKYCEIKCDPKWKKYCKKIWVCQTKCVHRRKPTKYRYKGYYDEDDNMMDVYGPVMDRIQENDEEDEMNIPVEYEDGDDFEMPEDVPLQAHPEENDDVDNEEKFEDNKENVDAELKKDEPKQKKKDEPTQKKKDEPKIEKKDEIKPENKIIEEDEALVEDAAPSHKLKPKRKCTKTGLVCYKLKTCWRKRGFPSYSHRLRCKTSKKCIKVCKKIIVY